MTPGAIQHPHDEAVGRFDDPVAITPPPHEGWIALLAPVVVMIGIGFVLVASPFALIMAWGGFGDCFDVACESDKAYWASIGTGPAFMWAATVAVLAIVAHRRDHRLWLAVAVVCASASAAGLISAQVGIGNRTPTLNGVSIPVVSPAFIPLAPGAFFLAIGALMLFIGARQDGRAGVDLP